MRTQRTQRTQAGRTSRTRSPKRRTGGTQTISIAMAICTPARGRVLTALKPYGIKPKRLDTYSLFPDGSHGKDGTYLDGKDENGGKIYATRFCADITVSNESAKWVEYLCCRAGWELLSKPLDARNQGWAAKWGGTMPRPWIGDGCNVPTKEARQGRHKTILGG